MFISRVRRRIDDYSHDTSGSHDLYTVAIRNTYNNYNSNSAGNYSNDHYHICSVSRSPRSRYSDLNYIHHDDFFGPGHNPDNNKSNWANKYHHAYETKHDHGNQKQDANDHT